MNALLITRLVDDTWQTQDLFETDIPALVNVKRPPPFSF